MIGSRVVVVCLAVTLAGGAAQAADINSMEEALANAGTCVYPAGYVDTLAQGGMAPPHDARPAVEPSATSVAGAPATDALIARVIAARDYAGGMSPLPLPLSRLIRTN